MKSGEFSSKQIGHKELEDVVVTIANILAWLSIEVIMDLL